MVPTGFAATGIKNVDSIFRYQHYAEFGEQRSRMFGDSAAAPNVDRLSSDCRGKKNRSETVHEASIARWYSYL